MTLDVSTAIKAARLAATRDQIDAGAGNATLEIYGTAKPAAGGSPGGAPLAVINFANPCGTIVDGKLVLTQEPPDGDQIDASGTAVWGRILDADGNYAIDGTMGYIDPLDPTNPATRGDFNLLGSTGTALYRGGFVLLGTCKLV